MELTQELVRELFDYRDGWLYWKAPRKKITVGSKAGNKLKTGYYQVCVAQRSYYLHRVIFLLHHGYMPTQVDHIDLDPSNNRIENLRPATQSQNNCNKQSHGRNTSGYKGVSLRRDTGRWQAVINVSKQRIHLGYFDSPESAAQAYAEAAQRYHGEFARS